MGTFSDLRPEDNQPPRRSNHKRTSLHWLLVPTAQVELVRAKAEAAGDTIHVEWLSEKDGLSELMHYYGPVYGSFKNDVMRTYRRWNVDIVNGPRFEGEVHEDDCEHPSHNHD